VSAQDIVSRLDFCKQSGKNKWQARCPAHDDKSPSLTITELTDGRVLIHCHAGCGSNDVLDAMGLDYEALFPPDDNYRSLRRNRSENPSYDDLVLAIAKDARKSGKTLTEKDKATEIEAFMRRRKQ